MSGTRSDRVRVLIVDDEPTLTELLSVAVTEAGWRPYPAADGHSAPHLAVLGDLVLAEETREVHRDGTAIQLTAKEFELLGLLLSHPRQVLSKARILAHVWSSSFDAGGNLVEVYISSLRRKIDKGRAPMIHTVRGVGYAIRPPEDGR
ncbi:DNA-binding response regulator [Streptomyces sp. R21]|uniref:DNA-binding response regulator n=1 Tax=Streptomyces sp. R21 TaxID=3238627 RepID=A0AB39P8C6_9ACTN